MDQSNNNNNNFKTALGSDLEMELVIVDPLKNFISTIDNSTNFAASQEKDLAIKKMLKQQEDEEMLLNYTSFQEKKEERERQMAIKDLKFESVEEWDFDRDGEIRRKMCVKPIIPNNIPFFATIQTKKVPEIKPIFDQFKEVIKKNDIKEFGVFMGKHFDKICLKAQEEACAEKEWLLNQEIRAIKEKYEEELKNIKKKMENEIEKICLLHRPAIDQIKNNTKMELFNNLQNLEYYKKKYISIPLPFSCNNKKDNNDKDDEDDGDAEWVNSWNAAEELKKQLIKGIPKKIVINQNLSITKKMIQREWRKCKCGDYLKGNEMAHWHRSIKSILKPEEGCEECNLTIFLKRNGLENTIDNTNKHCLQYSGPGKSCKGCKRYWVLEKCSKEFKKSNKKTCTGCNNEFADLYKHQKICKVFLINNNLKQEKWECSNCSKVYFKKQNYKEHIIKCNALGSKSTCSKCGEEYYDLAKRHTCNPDKRNKDKCHNCGLLVDIKKHRCTQSNKSRRYIRVRCKFCSKNIRRDNLPKHTINCNNFRLFLTHGEQLLKMRLINNKIYRNNMFAIQEFKRNEIWRRIFNPQQELILEPFKKPSITPTIRIPTIDEVDQHILINNNIDLITLKKKRQEEQEKIDEMEEYKRLNTPGLYLSKKWVSKKRARSHIRKNIKIKIRKMIYSEMQAFTKEIIKKFNVTDNNNINRNYNNNNNGEMWMQDEDTIKAFCKELEEDERRTQIETPNAY